MRLNNTAEDRFWRKVDKNGDNGCWVWKSQRFHHGHGSFMAHPQEPPQPAHRVAFQLIRGKPPGDNQVNHHCDNPACVNPDHLYIGDQSDNMQDASRRRRLNFGEDNHQSKLTHNQVDEIRSQYSGSDITQQELADEYGVHQTVIGKIVRGEIWQRSDSDA